MMTTLLSAINKKKYIEKLTLSSATNKKIQKKIFWQYILILKS